MQWQKVLVIGVGVLVGKVVGKMFLNNLINSVLAPVGITIG